MVVRFVATAARCLADLLLAWSPSMEARSKPQLPAGKQEVAAETPGNGCEGQGEEATNQSVASPFA